MNEQTGGSGDGVSMSMGTLLGKRGGSLTRDSEGKIKRHILTLILLMWRMW
jgi:hypothetical protein